MVPAPTVFIVDKDRSARESLDVLIRASGWQTECFASAEEFLARPRAMRPGCLLLDVSLPQLDGLALQEIIADRREMPVVFVTTRHDVGTTVRAMKAGAVDFLSKPASHPAIVGAVRCALDRSQRALTEEASMRALRNRYVSLTRREREVLELVVSGRLNKQIAAELGTSEITVKVHRMNMKRKMEADSLATLVRMAAQLGLRCDREAGDRSSADAGNAGFTGRQRPAWSYEMTGVAVGIAL
jgi:FixJ family two-component response regulator